MKMVLDVRFPSSPPDPAFKYTAFSSSLWMNMFVFFFVLHSQQMQLNLTGMTEPPFFLYVETDTWQLHNQQEYNLSSDLFRLRLFAGK